MGGGLHLLLTETMVPDRQSQMQKPPSVRVSSWALIMAARLADGYNIAIAFPVSDPLCM